MKNQNIKKKKRKEILKKKDVQAREGWMPWFEFDHFFLAYFPRNFSQFTLPVCTISLFTLVLMFFLLS